MKNIICRIRGHRWGRVYSGRNQVPHRYDCIRCGRFGDAVLISARPPILGYAPSGPVWHSPNMLPRRGDRP